MADQLLLSIVVLEIFTRLFEIVVERLLVVSSLSLEKALCEHVFEVLYFQAFLFIFYLDHGGFPERVTAKIVAELVLETEGGEYEIGHVIASLCELEHADLVAPEERLLLQMLRHVRWVQTDKLVFLFLPAAIFRAELKQIYLVQTTVAILIQYVKEEGDELLSREQCIGTARWEEFIERNPVIVKLVDEEEEAFDERSNDRVLLLLHEGHQIVQRYKSARFNVHDQKAGPNGLQSVNIEVEFTHDLLNSARND